MNRVRFLIIVMIFCAAFSTLKASDKIDFVPKPASVEYLPGQFTIDRNMSVSGGDSWNMAYLKKHLDRVFDFDVKIGTKGSSINFEKGNGFGEEGYSIEITEKGITVTSSSRAGEFYAIQTLLQMMPAAVYKECSTKVSGMMLKKMAVPCLKITDSPRFSYRGSMLDVSRTFFDKEYILRHLDFLSYHKINKFHWHLVDDNGWRIEIKKYPELTKTGAWRGRDCALPPAYNSGADPYGGFYTQEEIKDVIEYADERGITIIPEVDLPGHMVAALAAYPELGCFGGPYEVRKTWGIANEVLCPGKESTFTFLEDVLAEGGRGTSGSFNAVLVGKKLYVRVLKGDILGLAGAKLSQVNVGAYLTPTDR